MGSLTVPRRFLDLLGWKVAKAEKKCLPFSEVFVSLGVQVDLSQTKSGCVVLSHKPGSIDNLEDQVEELIASGKMNFKEALSIRGKVYFLESQVLAEWRPQSCTCFRGGSVR